MAAVLHDVVEDTSITLDDLRSKGFTREVLDAVDALIKKPGESRLDAAHRASLNPIARQVKLADIKDNMNLSLLQRQQRKITRECENMSKSNDYLRTRARDSLSFW